MGRNERRRLAIAAAVLGAAAGAAGIAYKAQRDAEVGQWVDKLREAKRDADKLTASDDITRIAQAADEAKAVVFAAEKAHFPKVDLTDKTVQSARTWKERLLDAPDDKTALEGMARALAAVSRQGETGVKYADALVKSMRGHIAERRIRRPPIDGVG